VVLLVGIANHDLRQPIDFPDPLSITIYVRSILAAFLFCSLFLLRRRLNEFLLQNYFGDVFINLKAQDYLMRN